MSDSFAQEEALFQQALDLPAAQRPAFFATIADAQLRARVVRLVEWHERPAGIFDGAAITGANSISSIAAHEPHPEEAGARIGRYRLIERIGEGGWGVVWRAEQEEPVRRQVALKVIKLGLDTRAVIARFEAERQALAMMDHPNIARVLDAGATDAGRPFFVMELVAGSRITEYCDQRRLPTATRLQLFVDVCLAIQHAHQKGIIHRDIKPSNVLVTEVDGLPVPKVIDFGIAKATQERLSTATQVTNFAHVIGTPAYMSPEQAAPGAIDVDTRSDIYSLGVLLYELLAGKLPFETHDVLQAGLDAMREMIREREPPRPSVRLRTTAGGELSAIAQRRSTEPVGLIRQARGDLDWIVMKTLAKERSRRYATAGDLAADVRRHLQHEPVVARAPGLWYRLGKYARRRRATFITTSVVLLALVAGLAFALIGFRRAVAARQEAEAVTRFLANMLAAANPSAGGQKDVSVRAVLDAAATRVATEFVNQPLVQARLHETIGATYGGLGLYEQARDQYRETLAIRERELGRTHELTLRVGLDRAEMTSLLDAVPEAEAALREILAVYDAHPGSYPAADRGWACFMIGNCLAAQGRNDDAAVFDQRAAKIFEQAFGPWHENTLKAKGNVIANFINTGEAHKARPLLEDMLAHAPMPPDSAMRIVCLLDTAVAESATGAFALADAHLREAEQRANTTFGPEHRLTLNARYQLGDAMVRAGDVAGGTALLEQTTQIQERVLGREESSTLEVRAALAHARGLGGQVEESLQQFREILPLWREKRGVDGGYFMAVKRLVDVLAKAGRAAEVETQCQSTLAEMTTAGSRDAYTRAALRIALGQAQAVQGRDREAEQELLECHATLHALDFDVRPQLRRVCEALAALYAARGDAAQAARWRANAPAQE